MNCTTPQTPLRVLCTGYRSGGGYAELCGVWAAATYPRANIRTITFGAPEVWINPVSARPRAGLA